MEYICSTNRKQFFGCMLFQAAHQCLLPVPEANWTGADWGILEGSKR